MQIHKMADTARTAGGAGFEDLPIRAVKVPHPTLPGLEAVAYECEFTFEREEVLKVLRGGRLRICILAAKVVPIRPTIVGRDEA